jgi:hypothetical protein
MKAKGMYVVVCAGLWALYGFVTFVLILGYSGFAAYLVVWAVQGAIAGTGTMLLLPLTKRLIKQSAIAEYAAAAFIGALCLTWLNLNNVIFSTAQLSTQVIQSMTLVVVRSVFGYSLIGAGVAVIASRRQTEN